MNADTNPTHGSSLNRRSAMRTLGGLCGAGFLSSLGILGQSAGTRAAGAGAAGVEKKRPNVLLIMSDDHAAYVSGTYGNPKARTPNIDRLARTGVRFNNAFVNCPMCTPSRQSLITGRLPHSIQVTQLRTALQDEALTLAEVLKQEGYKTASFGKMHFNSNLMHGFDRRLDHKEHRASLKDNPPRPLPPDQDVLPAWRPFRDPAEIWLNGSYRPYGAYGKDMAGTWFARKAQEYLREQRDDPFFLIVSFYEPHSPFRFPIEYGRAFDPSSFGVPEVLSQDEWQIPEIFRDLTDEQKQGIIASYYTSTEYMDHNVGRVLDTLDDTGLRENTLVIYLGDHGYSLGHHGRFEKHTHFEESVRAPLIARLPGKNRLDTDVDALVEFIDIFPTVVESCGAELPENVEGRSLLPLLEGRTVDGREAVFSEYYDNEEAMVRTKRYKFIYSTGKRERQDGYKTGLSLSGRTRILYDLQTDPRETTNLATDQAYADTIAELETEMLRRFTETHPAAKEIPSGLTREDALEYFLTYREENP